MEYSNVTLLGKDSDASEEAFFPSASVESGAELPTKIEKAVNDECAALDLGENAAHRKGKITMLDTFEDESIMQVARTIGRHGSRCA